MFLFGNFKKMISVFNRSHLFSSPLRSVLVIVVHVLFKIFLKFSKTCTVRIIKLILHVSEERFCRCIIYAVSPSRHGLSKSYLCEDTAKTRMSIVKSLVRMR